jgi:hypothetical protein
MMKWRHVKVPIIVAFGFAVALALATLIAYLRAQQPTLEESCVKECAAKHKLGRLVGKYPPHMLPSTRNPRVCECYL